MTDRNTTPKIVMVGHPNVGKSMLFNRLTGRTASVSNYPGTTVEVERGHLEVSGRRFEVLDLPGMHSLTPISEEEAVARRELLTGRPFLVLHVADAKNLERSLPLTLRLIEGGLPLILVLNMMDEARRAGLDFDVERLEKELGVPVVPTVSTRGQGVEALKGRIASWAKAGLL